MNAWKLQGWMNFSDLYSEIAEAAPPQSIIVEIGVAFGRSTCYMARRLIDLGKHDVRFFAVDAWTHGGALPEPAFSTSPFADAMRGMVEHAPEELERVSVLRCLSVEAARMFEDESLFAVFIDGDHSYESVKADLLAWQDKVMPHGIFAGHDIDLEGVKRAVDEIVGAYSIRFPSNTDWAVGKNYAHATMNPCWVRT